MSLKLRCPKCREPHELEARFAGKKVRCGECQHVFQVPEPEPGLKPIEDEPRKRAAPRTEEVDDVEVVEEIPVRKRPKPPAQEPLDDVEVVDSWGMKPKKKRKKRPGIGEAIAGGVGSAVRILVGVVGAGSGLVVVLILLGVGANALTNMSLGSTAVGEVQSLLDALDERLRIQRGIQDRFTAEAAVNDLRANNERVLTLFRRLAARKDERVPERVMDQLRQMGVALQAKARATGAENRRIMAMSDAGPVVPLLQEFGQEMQTLLQASGFIQ
jgi:hypothetical protein